MARISFILYLALTLPILCRAQLPCTGGTDLFYYLDFQGIINIVDPSQPLSPGNPHASNLPPLTSASGLAICNNLNGPGPSPTFYAVVYTPGLPGNHAYYYYDGNTWVYTAHASGPSAVNPTGAGPYIFSLSPYTGEIYRYDGTGNAVLITTLSTFDIGGPFDLAGDCEGNFYILKTTAPASLKKYSPAGVLKDSFKVAGIPSDTLLGGGGMSIIGNHVYLNNSAGFWSGTVTGKQIDFILAAPYNPSVSNIFDAMDFASCPINAYALGGLAKKDTVYYCSGSGGAVVEAEGSGPFEWQVLEGSATITGTGASVAVNTEGEATVEVHTPGNAGCGPATDTMKIIPLSAKAEAGPALQIRGCGNYTDTLQATLTDTSPGFDYTLSWSPAASVLSGANTLEPVIGPDTNTAYVLTVTASAGPTTCIWTDTVNAVPEDASVTADFSYDIRYSCTGMDTVSFRNLSSGATTYTWSFPEGEQNGTDNPVYIFPAPDVYNVLLTAANDLCKDTASGNINTGTGREVLGTSCDCMVSMPSAFTPNGDGKNDYLRPVTEARCNVKGYILYIYDRWGQLIYTGTDFSNGWDGRINGEPADLGVYMYQVQLEAGTESNKFKLKGDVSLIR